MQTIFELVDSIADQVQAHVNTLTKTDAASLGLDPRAGRVLFVGDGVIAVNKLRAGDLEYYGGLSYCKDCRAEMGDFVMYFAGDDESNRVRAALEYYAESVAALLDK